jgi:hypothetical protein
VVTELCLSERDAEQCGHFGGVHEMVFRFRTWERQTLFKSSRGAQAHCPMGP